MRSHRRTPLGPRLFAVYALASLVPVSILAVVLMVGYNRDGHGHALDQGRAQAAVIEQMAIAPALSGANLAAGLSGAERERLRSATDLAIFHGSVVRLRVYSFEGKVTFSDDGRVRGGLPVRGKTFLAAANGQVEAQIVPAGPRSASAVIRVVEPIVADTNGRAIGVLEVHLPYEPIAAEVRADTQRTIMRLAVGLVGLYAILALISWWTTRALRRHASDHEHQALHDPLTALPNREFFRRAAEAALAERRDGDRVALVLVDLDHFKEVNDTLGHHAGDELLRTVGCRLSESLRTDDTVARLGGDEFGIVLPRASDREAIVGLLTHVREDLGREVTLDGSVLSVEASFGVSFYPDDAHDVEGLLQRADAAMYRGKHGTAGVVVYDSTAHRPITDTLVMQREFRRALDRDELVLHYQPKMHLRSGRITSVEALVRWQHPDRGLLPPSQFLPVAERSDLIETMTRWVLMRALRDYTGWTAAGLDWTVAVNVSARTVSSLHFVEEVTRILHEADVSPDRLHLEVNETALTFDGEVARGVVNALGAQGISTAVDDFGIGFTGLLQLRSIDVAEIKIDRTFVQGVTTNPQDGAIVRSIIDLAHRLGCEVTAEGVETQEVADWLLAAGCDYGQGYFWARPAPWASLPDLIAVGVSTSTAPTERTSA